MGRAPIARMVQPWEVTMAPEAKTQTVDAKEISVSFTPCMTGLSSTETALVSRVVVPMKPRFQPTPSRLSAP